MTMLLAAGAVGIAVWASARAVACSARHRVRRRGLRLAGRGVPVRPGGRPVPAWVLGLVVPPLLWVAVGPGAAVMVGLALAVGAPWLRSRRASADLRRDVEHLPELVDDLARSLRAGCPALDAIEAAASRAPTGLATTLRSVAGSARRGVPLVEALDRWGRASPVDGASLVATALVLAAGTGGDAARSLEGVAATLRDRAALRREVLALSSQARLSALVIAAAPVAFAALAALADPATATFLFRTPLGLACLVAGLALDVAGWRWMLAITESVP